MDSIDEIFQQLKFDFKKDNIKLIEGIHLLKIIIPIDLIKEKEMIFELPIKIKKDIEKFDILFKEVTNLKKEINTLKEENNKLKDENKNLKELFEKYIPCLEKCKQNYINSYLSENSLIIKSDIKKQNTVFDWIEQKINKKIQNIELIYRMTKDGNKGTDFHKNCDNVGPTLTLIKTSKNYIFGGFTPLNWDQTSSFNYDLSNQTFIFSLNFMKKYDMIDSVERSAIKCTKEGPIFGDWDFGLHSPMTNGETYANTTCNFLSDNNLELTEEIGEYNLFNADGYKLFKIIY